MVADGDAQTLAQKLVGSPDSGMSVQISGGRHSVKRRLPMTAPISISAWAKLKP
ncbi:MAG: hypothetical protein R3D26_11620 [Cyanobacteriota/Melainabacteria group bacterium]